MAVDTLLRRRIDHTVGVERKLPPRTYLSYYMPFVGIRYYAIFNEDDIAEGRHRIGPVGWRLHEPLVKGEPEIKMRVPIAA